MTGRKAGITKHPRTSLVLALSSLRPLRTSPIPDTERTRITWDLGGTVGSGEETWTGTRYQGSCVPQGPSLTSLNLSFLSHRVGGGVATSTRGLPVPRAQHTRGGNPDARALCELLPSGIIVIIIICKTRGLFQLISVGSSPTLRLSISWVSKAGVHTGGAGQEKYGCWESLPNPVRGAGLQDRPQGGGAGSCRAGPADVRTAPVFELQSCPFP
jgi:hypothetical protein